jgi:hypothetical protein
MTATMIFQTEDLFKLVKVIASHWLVILKE